ncbi:protein-glutamine gamma-glutamyltransferase [Bacillus sp. S/N-304-OC-R1]|uniref:protein-glutamine gamma-glutamyltransferase n=1 Tax=Bacillus sp. S/N-304-OC-R1 TaxID=2758034 RepID=UPI001C8E76C4|nr:protein-glutamine gamma-glutamyltransferase [Bacillus sp. S/N-304-OC-R1]MBY0120966.1 protein-glutamine gamma-glutamyltransferase [Bacillus sp. S/N-304-OC-R1]
MIYLQGYSQAPLNSKFQGTQKEIYFSLENSSEVHHYDTIQEFFFDIQLRENIINAAKELSKSTVKFAPFQTSKFNPKIWTKIKYGYLLNPLIQPSDAINDVFENGNEYAFECSTAIIIIYYKAVLQSISLSYFNTLFQRLLVWDWNYDRDLSIITEKGSNFIPGDVVYFYNPDFNHPVWMGENAVFLGNDLFFGHGIGIKTKEDMIKALNTLRKEKANTSAYLISQHSRLNYKYLSQFAKSSYY